TQKAELAWDLRGLSKDLSGLEGWVKLKTGEGRFENLGLLASENPLLKTALLPFLILQKISGLVKIPLFPAFDRVAFREITGDYAFQKGVMAVKESHLDGSEAYVAVTGTADLPKDELDLRLSTKLGTQVGLRLSGPVGITVKGSLSDPKVSVDPLSIIKQPGVDKVIEGGKKMLEEGGKKLLEGLFKK
ncbi:MAG: AsmA-like C-terminal region-containing protein, partial [Elusimicrobiota bacterium]